ncbi:M1 family aminopeptidase [Hymenobacter sp. HD11105]
MKFWTIFRFELAYQLGRPSTWLYVGAVLGLVALVINEIAEYATTVEAVLLTAPLTVAAVTGYASKFGFLLLAALAGDGARRDVQARLDPLLYTTSLRKLPYLGGRLAATFALGSLLLGPVVPLSLLLARFTPGVDSSLFGPLQPAAYGHAFLLLLLPNVFIATALFYSLALVTRRAMAAYAGALGLGALSTFSLEITTGNWQWAQLLDPSALLVVTAERLAVAPGLANTQGLALAGPLLANRALWVGISLLVAGAAYARFRLMPYLPTRSRRQRAGAPPPAERVRPRPADPPPRVQLQGWRAQLHQTRALAGRFAWELVTSPLGWAIPAIALYAVVLLPNLLQGPVSVPGFPTTARVAALLNNAALEITIVLFLSLLVGQVVWRERAARLQEMVDAAPVSTGVLVLSKYLAVALALGLLLLALLAAGLTVQLLGGVDQLEVGQYLRAWWGPRLLEYLLLAAVALAIHVLANQPYVGHLLVVLLYFYSLLPGLVGVEHPLLVFGFDPGLGSSVFYGAGPFLLPWALFRLYWTGWALLALVMAQGLWVRGRGTGRRGRVRRAWSGRAGRPLFGLALLLVAGPGAVIFYHTNGLNEYTPAAEKQARQAAYERRYGPYRAAPHPHLTGTRLRVELYPDQHRALVAGTYQLCNGSGHALDSLHVAVAAAVTTRAIRFSRPATAVRIDNRLGHHIYRLAQPLLPGDSLQMSFQVEFAPQGFTSQGVATAVMDNGTYFTNADWLPALGYQPGRELGGERPRRGQGLPPRPAAPSPRLASARLNRFGRERIRLDVTVGTAAGQLAVAPGSLRRSWRADGRQYFQYETDAPIRNLYPVYSARYAVRESRFGGTDLQVFYHPRHELNLARMEQSLHASLAYYTQHFSAYPLRQLKLVEYPDPGTGGISLPGTIGYSTNFAFLHPARDARGFDLPFAVVAHEVAHQWWAHQLINADVPGAGLITESLAWYSALNVVEQSKGPAHLRRLLDALRQTYLNPRARAGTPLLRAEDAFQAYRKGPLAMYALREYVGEENLNRALRALLLRFKAGEPPYATSLDFYAEVQRVTPDSLHYLLQDLLATNTFWELKTQQAQAAPTGDGAWLVTLNVRARKVRVDAAGTETEVAMNDLVEVGVFGQGSTEASPPLFLQTRRLKSGNNKLVIKVLSEPGEAGIDPRHLLIDTELADNSRRVTRAPISSP